MMSCSASHTAAAPTGTTCRDEAHNLLMARTAEWGAVLHEPGRQRHRCIRPPRGGRRFLPVPSARSTQGPHHPLCKEQPQPPRVIYTTTETQVLVRAVREGTASEAPSANHRRATAAARSLAAHHHHHVSGSQLSIHRSTAPTNQPTNQPTNRARSPGQL